MEEEMEKMSKERKMEIDGKEYTWEQYRKKRKWSIIFTMIISICCGAIGGHGIVQGFVTGNPYYFLLLPPLILWVIKLQINTRESKKKIKEIAIHYPEVDVSGKLERCDKK